MFGSFYKVFTIIALLLILAGGGAVRAEQKSPDALADLKKSIKEEPYYDPSDYKAWKKNFKYTPVEKMLFRNDKGGCASKLMLISTLIDKYKTGESLDDLLYLPEFNSYLKEKYAAIETKSVAQAQKEMMAEYQTCMKNAQQAKDLSREYDLQVRHGACSQLGNILMAAANGIKDRRSIGSIMNRYERNAPDLSETGYGKVNDPVPFFIGQIYKVAQETQGDRAAKYEAALDSAVQITLGCGL